MGILNIAQVEPGMVLEGEVKDRSGRVLLGSGVTLTERHLRTLKTWGVAEVAISGAAGRDDKATLDIAEVDPAMLAEVQAELLPSFKHVNLEHPVMKQLFEMRLLRTVRERMKA